MHRASETIYLVLDLVFKLVGLFVFVWVTVIEPDAEEKSLVLVVCALLLGFGEFLPGDGLFDVLKKGRQANEQGK